MKTSFQDIFKTSSPISYIIMILVTMFILTNVVGRLFISENIQSTVIEKLSLPNSFTIFVTQPWSLFTHPFIYKDLLPLVFDSLWIYWIGNMFQNLVSKKYFLFTFFGGLFIGALIFLLVSTLQTNTINHFWISITFGLSSLLGGIVILNPKSDIQLYFLGTVKLKTISIAYVFIQFSVLAFNNQFIAAIALIISLAFGIYFIKNIQKGNDWTKVFRRKEKSKLKFSYNSKYINIREDKSDAPNQEIIDKLLDKISLTGYESLSKKEKEMLFKASRNK